MNGLGFRTVTSRRGRAAAIGVSLLVELAERAATGGGRGAAGRAVLRVAHLHLDPTVGVLGGGAPAQLLADLLCDEGGALGVAHQRRELELWPALVQAPGAGSAPSAAAAAPRQRAMLAQLALTLHGSRRRLRSPPLHRRRAGLRRALCRTARARVRDDCEL